VLLVHKLPPFSLGFASQGSLHQGRLGEGLIVGYYGPPGASSLGVLGQHTIEELIPIIQAKADEYDQINGEQKVTPAFHLIYGLAASDPGRDKDYILNLPEKTVMKYITAGQSNGFLVFIDLQLGGLTPLEAVTPVLKYLKHDNVHLAIDPEFEVNGLDIRPGKVIGEISGQEVNQVQSAMADFIEKNGITEDKILIVHMFRKSMVKAGTSVVPHDKVNLIMNLDGHGSPELKVKIYNHLYTSEVAAKIAGGFKLFFQEDKPSMMTPKQVLGLAPVAGKTRIGESPLYINYQ
jgi:hypothetical protein